MDWVEGKSLTTPSIFIESAHAPSPRSPSVPEATVPDWCNSIVTNIGSKRSVVRRGKMYEVIYTVRVPKFVPSMTFDFTVSCPRAQDADVDEELDCENGTSTSELTFLYLLPFWHSRQVTVPSGMYMEKASASRKVPVSLETLRLGIDGFCFGEGVKMPPRRPGFRT